MEVLGDLQGPKFRVGELLDQPITLADGDMLEFGIAVDENDKIKPGRITMFETKEQLALMKSLSEGVSLLVDDGLLELRVTEVKSPTEVLVTVVHGGKVNARKGVNVPDVMIDCSALPEKDVGDAEYLLSLDPPVDYICVSFAQKGSDLQELIDIMVNHLLVICLPRLLFILFSSSLLILQGPYEHPAREATQHMPQDREATGTGQHRRDHGSERLANGGEGRSGSGAGTRQGALRPEAVGGRCEEEGTLPSDRRNPDDGVDDHQPSAHQGRGQRRRQRRVRWRGRYQ